MNQSTNIPQKNQPETIKKSYTQEEIRNIVILYESIKPHLSRLRAVTNTGEQTALSHVIHSANELLEVNQDAAKDLLEQIRQKMELEQGLSAVEILQRVNTDIIGMQQISENLSEVDQPDPLSEKLEQVSVLYTGWQTKSDLIDEIEINRKAHVKILGVLAEISHLLNIKEDITPYQVVLRARTAIADDHLSPARALKLQRLAKALGMTRGSYEEVMNFAAQSLERSKSSPQSSSPKLSNLFEALSLKPANLVTSILFDLSTDGEIDVEKRKLHSAMLGLLIGSDLVAINGSKDEFIAWSGMIGRTHCPISTRTAIAKDLQRMLVITLDEVTDNDTLEAVFGSKEINLENDVWSPNQTTDLIVEFSTGE